MLHTAMRNSIFVAIVAAAIIAIGGWYVGRISRTVPQEGEPVAQQPPGAIEPSTPPGVSPSGNVPPAPSLPPVPNLDRPVAVTAALSPEAEARAREEIARAVAELREDSDRYGAWLTLGLYRKAIGDYGGAREAWEYAAAIRPGTAVPHNNLGNLYAYELQEPMRAEQHYLNAIKKEPTVFQWYLAAYEYYRFIMRDTVRARAIVERGLRSDPQDRGEFERLLADMTAAQ